MKKILHIQVFPKMSGVQKVSLDILKFLSESEYEKHIVFSADMNENDKNHCKRLFENIGCKVIFLDSLKRSIGIHDISTIKDLYSLCKREKYDIVHTNSTKPGIVGRIAATMAGVPKVIHTVHGLAFHKFVKFPKWQFYWLCEMIGSLFCDKIVVVNKYYLKYFKWFKNKTVTIYNGVDFSQKPLWNICREDNEIRILFVGRLSLPKDPLTMLRAFNIVANEREGVRLTIVGDGELEVECRNYIKNNQLENKVVMEGWQNIVEGYYASHDIFITTSIYEAFGLVFLDAGYYQLPTIATSVEGIPEVIEDQITGLLSAPKDVEEIAFNLIKLIDNKQLRKDMGEQAKKHVMEKFDVSQMVKSYYDIYNS